MNLSLRWLMLTALAIAVASPPVDAQTVSLLSPGSRLRLFWSGSHSEEAVLVRASAETLWVQFAASRDTTSVAVTALREVQVFRGQRRAIRRRAWRGFLIGAGVGSAVGLTAAVFGDPESRDYFGGTLGTTA